MSICFHCNIILSNKQSSLAVIIMEILSILIHYTQIVNQNIHLVAMNQIMKIRIIRIIKETTWPIITAQLWTITVKFITMFILDTSETKNKTICMYYSSNYIIYNSRVEFFLLVITFTVNSSISDRRKLNIDWNGNVVKSTVQ